MKFFLLVLSLVLIYGCSDESSKNISWHDAVKSGNVQQVERHLKQGVDVNAVDELGWIPINLVATHGHVDVAKLLIESGADVNVENEHGLTPMHYAAQYRHLRLMALFKSKGAKTDVQPSPQPTNTGYRKCISQGIAFLKKIGTPDVQADGSSRRTLAANTCAMFYKAQGIYPNWDTLY